MEVLFVILKIIGIFLLILLLLCMALILVPVRYRVNLSLQDEVEGKAVVHWLLHLADVRIYYKEKSISYQLRIFGIPLPLGKKKGKKQKGQGRIKKGKKEKNISDKPEDFEPATPEDGFPKESIPQKDGFWEGDISRKESSQQEGISLKESFQKEDTLEKEDFPGERETSPEKGQKSSGRRKRRKQKKNKSFLEKIKTGFYNFKQKIRALIRGFGQRIEEIKSGTTTVKEQAENIKSMISEESSQSAFSHILREVRYLLRHYAPKTVSGNVTFSMGNPERTGKVLGAASLLPFWARSRMVIMPDFLSESFYAKGILFVAGHVRFLHMPMIGIRLITDKNIRKLITNIRK